ncbi:MAG: cytochrome c biogenesis protein CcsA [Gemmatimonadetes bacterium]|nr:cytochrome c biogenesis protein CcsA [Gemmatimonadota bacterium]
MTLLGELSLWVALVMAAWSAALSLAGGGLRRAAFAESGARGLLAAAAFTAIAVAGLLAALARRDFSLRFVASYTSADLPLAYAVAALWAGPDGAMLLGAFLLAACAGLAVRPGRGAEDDGEPWATGTLATILFVLLAVAALGANPYRRMDTVPPGGLGMPPRLQHPAMLVQPLVLSLGLVATAVPFAFAIAALVTRRVGENRVRAVRRWTVVAWSLLTTGIALGAWWTYDASAGATLWAWDPPVAASLLPWLTTGAYLAAGLAHERRGAERPWIVGLPVAGLPLAAFATGLAAGGIGGESPVINALGARTWFAIVVGMCALAAGGAARRMRAAVVEGIASRVGRGRRAGVALAIVGVALLAVGVAGFAFRRVQERLVTPGGSVMAPDPWGGTWRFAHRGLSRFDLPGRRVLALNLAVTRDDIARPNIVIEQREHLDARGVPAYEPVATAGVVRGLRQDLYVTVHTISLAEEAGLRIAFNPLVSWAWCGAALVVLGGIVALWPRAAA